MRTLHSAFVFWSHSPHSIIWLSKHIGVRWQMSSHKHSFGGPTHTTHPLELAVRLAAAAAVRLLHQIRRAATARGRFRAGIHLHVLPRAGAALIPVLLMALALLVLRAILLLICMPGNTSQASQYKASYACLTTANRPSECCKVGWLLYLVTRFNMG